jgi:5-methylcytosine-specific restriction endonuclease McrA
MGKKKGTLIICSICGNTKYYPKSAIKRGGGKFCSQKCSKQGQKRVAGVIASPEKRAKISANHHNVKGENNPNWKGGITSVKMKYRNKTWKSYALWREKVFKRDGYKCKDCGSTTKLHAHHIIARKTLPMAEFIRANGVTLCDKCHHKTDSWGGGKDAIVYNRKGNIVKYVMKVIPHHWQDYPTVGNYFHIKGGTIVIFCSDMKNDKYHQLIFAHEMFEVALVIARKIKIKDIDKFDMQFEKDREIGLHSPEDEPGHNRRAPYHKEHVFAEKMERAFAKALGVNWKAYDKTVNSL